MTAQPSAEAPATAAIPSPSAAPGVAAPIRPKFRLATFSSLKYRDYRILFATVVCTSGGQWMQQIALGWLAYEMTGSPFMLGAINGMRALPFLLLGPWGGVAADRMDRKLLMMVSQIWIMLLAIVMTILIVINRIEVWHLFAFTFLSGVGWVFTMPVRQTLLPAYVPKEELVNAVALQSAGFNFSRILGPTLAGLMLATMGAAGAFAIQAGLYIFILSLTMMLRVPPTDLAAARRQSPGRALIEGFRYIWEHPVVLWLIVLALVPMLFAFPLQSLLPIFAKDILQIGPEGYGMIVSFMGIGAFTGTLTVASLGNFKYKGTLLLLSATSLGMTTVLFSMSTVLSFSLLLIVLVGASQMTYMSMNNTLIHLNITDEVRGRVMSIYMLDQGLTPLGTLFAGTLATFFGAPFAATVLGVLCTCLSLIAFAKVSSVRRLA